MATIANMPLADVPLEFPDGKKINVNMVILLGETLSAECKVKHGHFLAQNMPTIDELREKYNLDYFFDAEVRTWENCAAVLRHVHKICSDHVKAHTGR